MAAWILLLLPFSLQQYGRSQYKSPTFIVMVIIGFCLFFVFAAWGLMIFLSVHGLSHVLILGMVGLYVVLKTFVEVQIAWSRDHTVSVDQARAARVEKLMSGH